MNKATFILRSILCLSLLALFPACNEEAAPPVGNNDSAAAEEVTVAWSVWTGWMPFKLMEKEGLLEKRAKELGVKVKLVEFKGYMDSVQAFAAKKVDACAMTSMEALQPASSGVKTVAVLVNDISHGGDGVLVREGMTMADLKGKEVLLEQFSVSHYLLSRALAENGIAEGEVKIKNIPGDDAGKAFLSDDSVKAVATWNPHLFLAKESKKGVVVFDSTNIEGEIIDLLVFNGDTLKKNPKAVEAVTLAWYDAMALITGADTKEAAIATMAEAAGASVDEFKKMMGGTNLFTDPAKASAFFKGDAVKATMTKIRDFSFKQELIKDKDFKIGYGAGSDALLSFDPSHADKIAK